MAAQKRLHKELVDLKKDPPFGVEVDPDDANMFHWKAYLHGPKESLYKGGVFNLDIVFPNDYPFKPPEVKFNTKIYHPNIDEDGKICIGLLKSDVWKPATKVKQVIEELVFLLLDPNPDDALVVSIADMYKTDRPKYEKTAKEYVKKYAMK